MSRFIGPWVGPIKQWYSDINSATLNGAIDVIVVEQEDGSFLSSPFHVRFGKIGVLNPREKVVDIEINGEPVDIHMELDDHGAGFFISNNEDEDVPPGLATTPSMAQDHPMLAKPEEKSSKKKRKRRAPTHPRTGRRASLTETMAQEKPSSSSEEFETDKVPSGDKTNAQEVSEGNNKVDDTLDEEEQNVNKRISSNTKKDTNWATATFSSDQSILRSRIGSNLQPIIESQDQMDQDEDKNYFSESDLTQANTLLGESSAMSDSEYETQQRRESSPRGEPGEEWKWGQLPGEKVSTNKKKKRDASADTSAVREIRSWMFSMFNIYKNTETNSGDQSGIYLDDLKDEKDEKVVSLYVDTRGRTVAQADDAESGHGSSLTVSPNPEADHFSGKGTGPSLMNSHPNLPKDIALSLCGGIVPAKTEPGVESAGASEVIFAQNILDFDNFIMHLKNDQGLLNNPDLVVRMDGEYLPWSAACPAIIAAVLYGQSLPSGLIKTLKASAAPQEETLPKEESKESESASDPSTKVPRTSSSWWLFGSQRAAESCEQGNENATPQAEAGTSGNPATSSSQPDEASATLSDPPQAEERSRRPSKEKKCKKTLRLSSDTIAKLALKPGANKAQFSVTTAYQGTSVCNCQIYVWKYTDKIVISDIDGTITKSDLLGHILPIIGTAWAQSGVAQLFTKIVANGYRIVYLSARPICQAPYTKSYINFVAQSQRNLPDGPILLNPTSLFKALHREVIERTPEKFKIPCMKDIRNLFPGDKNPFYAGYGNRMNDVYAYCNVGIPTNRIYTINTRGVVRHESVNTIQTSYECQSAIVDLLFPPCFEDIIGSTPEYSSYAFWKEPIPDLELEPEPKTKTK